MTYTRLSFKLAARISVGNGLIPFAYMAFMYHRSKPGKIVHNTIGIDAIHPSAALSYSWLHAKALSRKTIDDAKENYLIVCRSAIRN